MEYPRKTPAVQFHIECLPEAKSLFAVLDEAFGFKTNAASLGNPLCDLAQGQNRSADSFAPPKQARSPARKF
jgi:hypothetical protein